MNSGTLRITSIVQERFDAFLKEIFDIWQSSDESPTAKIPWGAVAAEAICDAVEAVSRRRKNKRTLFAHLPIDVVHSIFGMTLDVDRIHDTYLPLDQLDDNRRQLFLMRRVSSAWNDLLLSSPRYWQAINVTSPPQVVTAGIERSGYAPLCIYYFGEYPTAWTFHLPEGQRFHSKVRTLRSEDPHPYHLFRRLLRDAPSLQTLQLSRKPGPGEDNVEPLGDLPSIRHLTAALWQPPSDVAWLVGLKELVLTRYPEPDMELLRAISACANLERLAISQQYRVVVGELPGAISPITLPHLQSMRLEFQTNESAMQLIRRLITPQCLRRTLHIGQAQHLGQYVADYRQFMFMQDTQYPRSACTHLKGPGSWEKRFSYETDSTQVVFHRLSMEELSAARDLLQGLKDLFNGLSLAVTIDYSREIFGLFLRSLSDHGIRTIATHWRHNNLAVDELLKVIGTCAANTPDETMTNNATDWPFKSLRSIEIHNAYMNVDDFQRQVEGYLHKSFKPLLEEIVLLGCRLGGPELAQAAERLAAIGITIREVGCTHYQ